MGWRAVFAGAYGSVRSSEQLVFRQLVLQYRSVPAAEPDGAAAPAAAGLRGAVEALIAKGHKDGVTWLELYDLESMIVRLLDDDSLRHEAWGLREEFRNLATEELYKAYVDSKPPQDPRDAATPAPAVRRDVENLIRKLHELRLGRSLLDVIRAYTTGLTFGVTLCLVGLSVVVGYKSDTWSFPVLLLVAVGGIFGAGLSMLQRLSQIPSKGDLVARYPAASRRVVWFLTPLLSLTQGALAAIVLYFLFRAGLVSGALFPEFPKTDQPAGAACTVLAGLVTGSLSTVAEAAKLLVWSFAAGTAERLVPDLLTRLSDQASKSELGSKRPA